ncbi:MAG TPA: protein kinase [Pseudonocardiaceae bacterium]|nr:protein kinase [Pseudonocardiaceae bacterium]
MGEAPMPGDGSTGWPRLVAGRYAVIRELGRGGMGVVWLAEDQVIGRQVALKELRLPPGMSAAERAAHLERVLREVRTAGRLNHPGVVTVHDVLTDDGAVHIVMELAQAPTLADLVATEGPLGEDRAAGIAVQVLDALRTAHAAGIVHRDVKPANIMVLPGDRAKLADFGIAQAMDDPRLTVAEGIMGSPGYMAPELFSGSSPSPASDLWSLGATLFHAVEGRSPFARPNTAATMHAILTDTPSPRRCRGPLAEVITGLLTRPVADRLPAGRAREMLVALTIGADQPTVAVSTSIVDGPTTAVYGEAPTDLVSPMAAGTQAPSSTLPRPPWHDPTDSTAGSVGGAAGDDWAAKDSRTSRRRRNLLIGLVPVVVAAVLIPLLFFVNNQKSTPSAQAAPDRGAPTSSDPTSPSRATTNSAAPPASSGPDSALPPPPGTTAVARRSAVVTPAPGTNAAAPDGAVPPPAPSYPLLRLNRYNLANSYHYVTTPDAPPPAGYALEGPLGSLVTTEEPDTRQLWSCRYATDKSQFISIRSDCESKIKLGLLGWVFDNPPPNLPSVPLYRCVMTSTYGSADPNFFASSQSNCESQHNDGLAGYLVEK